MQTHEGSNAPDAASWLRESGCSPHHQNKGNNTVIEQKQHHTTDNVEPEQQQLSKWSTFCLYHFAEICILGDFNVHQLWLSFPFTHHPGEPAFNFAIFHDLEQLVQHLTHIPYHLGDTPNILDFSLPVIIVRVLNGTFSPEPVYVHQFLHTQATAITGKGAACCQEFMTWEVLRL
ncbi:hypothetical protein E2C01_003640 [Portunus trituberculatus]|uniref:Endonuclease/exonuclease/phosphatase domain-containing protein n=1 Tax=Portunus trituberculatus TaxID=210409 RepID=A0A5B7CQA8_PORTR|nr:hypothetical protein [Portunus trituberculatus]